MYSLPDGTLLSAQLEPLSASLDREGRVIALLELSPETILARRYTATSCSDLVPPGTFTAAARCGAVREELVASNF